MSRFANVAIYEKSDSLFEYMQQRVNDDLLEDEYCFIDHDIANKNLLHMHTIAHDDNLKYIYEEYSHHLECVLLGDREPFFLGYFYSYITVNKTFIPMYFEDIQCMNAYELAALSDTSTFKLFMAEGKLNDAEIWDQSGCQTICKNMILTGNWELIHAIENDKTLVVNSTFVSTFISDAMVAQLIEKLAICLNLSRILPKCSNFIKPTVINIVGYLKYVAIHYEANLNVLCNELISLESLVNSEEYTPDAAIEDAKDVFAYYYQRVSRSNVQIYHRIANDTGSECVFDRLQSLLVMTTDKQLFEAFIKFQQNAPSIASGMWEFLQGYIDFIPNTMRHLLAKYVITHSTNIKWNILYSKSEISIEELNETCDVDIEMMVALLEYVGNTYASDLDLSRIITKVYHNIDALRRNYNSGSMLLKFIDSHADKYKELVENIRFKFFVYQHATINELIEAEQSK